MQDHAAETSPGVDVPAPVEIDAAEVRQALDRVLHSPEFQGSKRYQELLTYLVTRRLEGDLASLKERVIGADVFGRDPAYDTSTDAIVRVKVGQLRKRLALYYDHTGLPDPVRIELPTGSYVPVFRRPGPGDAPPPAATPATAVDTLDDDLEPPPSRRAWLLGGLGLAAASAAGALLWKAPWRSPAPADLFWNPLLSTGEPVLVCFPARERWFMGKDLAAKLSAAAGQDRAALSLDLKKGDLTVVPEGTISVQIFRTILELGMGVARRGAAADFRLVSEISADQIRRGAVILVSAYHNPWAMEQSNDLRFVFESSGADSEEVCWVRDRRQPGKPLWIVSKLWPYGVQNVDFAIISRTFNRATGQTVVSISGVNGFGTQIAAEFLTQPGYWDQFAALAPAGWERRNFQIVLETKVIRGLPNPPRILATHVW